MMVNLEEKGGALHHPTIPTGLRRKYSGPLKTHTSQASNTSPSWSSTSPDVHDVNVAFMIYDSAIYPRLIAIHGQHLDHP